MKMSRLNVQGASLSLLFVTMSAFGQTAPTFEVASVKKADPIDVNMVLSGKLHIGMTIDSAMVNITSMSLVQLLRYAYKVNSYQISGPEWLNSERFNIVAKMPPGASRDQIPAMVQALLADRFKLALHHATGDLPVYALVVMKGGPKLKESPPDDPAAAPSAGPAAPLAPTPTDGGAQVRSVATSGATTGVVSTAGVNGNIRMVPQENGMRLELTKMNTTGLLETLGRLVDKPIVDMTGLKGRYDLNLDIGLDDMLKLAESQGVSIPVQRPSGSAFDAGGSLVFAAIENYGLKLERRKAPIDLLVIDRVEKTPTEN